MTIDIIVGDDYMAKSHPASKIESKIKFTPRNLFNPSESREAGERPRNELEGETNRHSS